MRKLKVNVPGKEGGKGKSLLPGRRVSWPSILSVLRAEISEEVPGQDLNRICSRFPVCPFRVWFPLIDWPTSGQRLLFNIGGPDSQPWLVLLFIAYIYGKYTKL